MDRIKDRCTRLLARCGRLVRTSTLTDASPTRGLTTWQKQLLRLVLATVFAQGSRTAASTLLPHVANKPMFFKAFCEEVVCASGTFHGVMKREVLCQSAFADLERYICRKWARASMHANLA